RQSLYGTSLIPEVPGMVYYKHVCEEFGWSVTTLAKRLKAAKVKKQKFPGMSRDKGRCLYTFVPQSFVDQLRRAAANQPAETNNQPPRIGEMPARCNPDTNGHTPPGPAACSVPPHFIAGQNASESPGKARSPKERARREWAYKALHDLEKKVASIL